MLNVDVRRNYRDAMPVTFLPNCPENNHYIESYNVFFKDKFSCLSEQTFRQKDLMSQRKLL